MNTVISKISIVATPLMVVCALLASGGAAMAQSDDAGVAADRAHSSCSNRTLSGDYGDLVSDGVLIGTPGLPQEAQFRTVGLYHFDGKGKITGLEHTVVNGASLEVDWTANSGTYSVNSNCTGTMVLNTPNSPVPLNIFFVVVRQGREIRTVLDTSAIAGTFVKVGEPAR
jgi:hypothetical protein